MARIFSILILLCAGCVPVPAATVPKRPAAAVVPSSLVKPFGLAWECRVVYAGEVTGIESCTNLAAGVWKNEVEFPAAASNVWRDLSPAPCKFYRAYNW